jgi:predicted DNA-binding WGR domain protein
MAKFKQRRNFSEGRGGTIVIPLKANPRAKKERVVFADYYVDFRERVLTKAAGEWKSETKPITASAATDTFIEYPTLYYTKPIENSDKEYRIRIVAVVALPVRADGYSTGYHVEFAYGKRGAKMNYKRKTTSWSLLKTCKSLAEALVEEKVKGGYTTKISGKPFSEPLPLTFKY